MVDFLAVLSLAYKLLNTIASFFFTEGCLANGGHKIYGVGTVPGCIAERGVLRPGEN